MSLPLKNLLTTVFLALTCVAQTGPTASQSVPPPEIKQTVQAVSGQWVGSMTAAFPGSKAEEFPWEMSCKAVALGSGAACSMKGMPSIGPIEETCLLAYDAEGKAVHFMCVTSMREVHDHKGHWASSRSIEFEPYKTTMAGHPVIEDVTFDFASSERIRTRSAITTEDGSRMTFEFSGSRR